MTELEIEWKARLKDQNIPEGLGQISLFMLDGEVCDWNRFHNRKQIGSYTGCSPGEHSSGGKRRLGSIDRIGNGRMRSLLVEAVWRFPQWQPDWKSAQKIKQNCRRPGATTGHRPWRWRTGRCTMADLGWKAA